MSNVTITSGIRGISEERRTPRLGKIRLGVQAPNKSGEGTHPEMSPYFVFDGDTAAGALLYEMFGEQCTEIPVAFPTDDPTEFARRNLEMWGAGTLKCRGNGAIALALVNPAEHAKYAAGKGGPVPAAVWASTSRAGNANRDNIDPVRETIPCGGLGYDGQPPCVKFAEANGDRKNKDCKATMHLQMIVRGFPGLGIFQIDTGSVVNIQRLDDFLAFLGNFTGGRYAMIPLVMRLEPYDMKGRKYYGVTFTVDFAEMHAQGVGALPGMSTMSIPERVLRFLPEETARPASAALLPVGVEDEAPADVDPQTGEIIEGAYSEEPDDAPLPEPPAVSAPTVAPSPEALEAASVFVREVADRHGAHPDAVLHSWGADYWAVANDLAGYRERYEAKQRARAEASA